MCAWHVSNNLKKHFAYLNRLKSQNAKKIYQSIISLPYNEYIGGYEDEYKGIVRSKDLSPDSIAYLQKRNEYCDLLVKAFMKNPFTGSTYTTSRIESKHRIFKKILNSGSSLIKVFQTFAYLEQIEIENFQKK